MTAVRKRHAGMDTFGNVWPHDGAVINVLAHQAAELVRIKDSGCEVVDDSLLPILGAEEPNEVGPTSPDGGTIPPGPNVTDASIADPDAPVIAPPVVPIVASHPVKTIAPRGKPAKS